MNDPNKRIDVNLSSLLSLKAELLRKHQEVSKAKSTHLISNFVPQRSAKSAKASNKTEQTPGKVTENVQDTYEDMELLKKSRRVLEAKSKLYDRMCQSGGTLNSDENSLVMFNEKKQTIRKAYSSSEDEDDADKVSEPEDGDWVEYTDCLGRTRKCLKEDVDFFKKKDQELAGSVSLPTENKFVAPTPPAWFEDKKGEPEKILEPSIAGDYDQDDTLSMMSKSSKIEEIRNNWEKLENENAVKDSIHYQNVLFDEARTHGVGYYAFSTDELERAKQQKELEVTRNKTLDAQKIRDDQRKAREKIIAERVRAAQNRQRARAGLPPLEANPEPAIPEPPVITETDLKKLAKEAKQARNKELESIERDAARKQHVRPWDKGKTSSRKRDRNTDDDEDDDEEWTYKPEKEPMSQEKWNEMQRAERKNEFAPMPEPAPRNFQPFIRARIVNEVSDNDDEEVDYDIAPPPPPVSKTGSYHHDFAPPVNEFQSRTSSNASKNQQFTAEGSFAKRNKKPFVRRHVDHADDDAADKNECMSYDIDVPASIPSRNPDFAPPPTFEYYGPSSSTQKRAPGVKPAQLASSIEAGLKFLREQSDKDTVSTKMKWSSNAGY